MFFKKEKDYDYFDYFIRTAAFACEAAACLHDSLADFNEDLFRSRMAKMHEIENRADNEKHDMMSRLSHEFITPIEREDIVALAHRVGGDNNNLITPCIRHACNRFVSRCINFA